MRQLLLSQLPDKPPLIANCKEENQMLLEKLRKKKLKIAKLRKKRCEMILKEAERGEGAEEE